MNTQNLKNLELRRLNTRNFDECILRGDLELLTAHMESIIESNELSFEKDVIKAGAGNMVIRYFTRSKYGTSKIYYINLG